MRDTTPEVNESVDPPIGNPCGAPLQYECEDGREENMKCAVSHDASSEPGGGNQTVRVKPLVHDEGARSGIQ